MQHVASIVTSSGPSRSRFSSSTRNPNLASTSVCRKNSSKKNHLILLRSSTAPSGSTDSRSDSISHSLVPFPKMCCLHTQKFSISKTRQWIRPCGSSLRRSVYRRSRRKYLEFFKRSAMCILRKIQLTLRMNRTPTSWQHHCLFCRLRCITLSQNIV